MIILTFIITLGTLCFAKAVNATKEANIQTLTVQSGDTLWCIANFIAPDQDPRTTIAKIKFLNKLDGSDLQIGQNLKVVIDN